MNTTTIIHTKPVNTSESLLKYATLNSYKSNLETLQEPGSITSLINNTIPEAMNLLQTEKFDLSSQYKTETNFMNCNYTKPTSNNDNILLIVDVKPIDNKEEEANNLHSTFKPSYNYTPPPPNFIDMIDSYDINRNDVDNDCRGSKSMTMYNLPKFRGLEELQTRYGITEIPVTDSSCTETEKYTSFLQSIMSETKTAKVTIDPETGTGYYMTNPRMPVIIDKVKENNNVYDSYHERSTVYNNTTSSLVTPKVSRKKLCLNTSPILDLESSETGEEKIYKYRNYSVCEDIHTIIFAGIFVLIIFILIGLAFAQHLS